jgi:succinyl-diaminopimelate desuccinylase
MVKMDEIELTKKLVRIPSVSGDKRSIDDAIYFCSEQLKNKNIILKTYNNMKKPMLVATFKDTNSPDVFFIGHIDVVDSHDPNLFNPYYKDGLLFGAGTLDMKGMVAVFLGMMGHYAEIPKKPNIGLIISSDEEVGGKNGVHYLVNNEQYRCKLAIAGEPTRLAITLREKGVLWLRLGYRGESAHGSTPFLAKNAVDCLTDRLNYLTDKYNKANSTDFWKTSFVVSYIQSGSANIPNRVPDYATATIDIRFTSTKQKGMLLKDIHESGLEIVEEILDTQRPSIADKDDPLIRSLGKIANEKLGNLSYSDARFFSDAGFFSRAGMPAVCFGPSGEGTHTSKEYVNIDSLIKAKEILYSFVDSLRNII